MQVGKVSSHDDTTKMISITPVPEYPVHVQQPEDAHEDGQPDVDLFLPPYNSDGTLEVRMYGSPYTGRIGFSLLSRIMFI